MKINAKTIICGIIGNPIEHSLSPAIHNAGYEKLGLNFAYVAFKVEKVRDALSGIRGLNIKGVSVTIPHKVNVIPLLDGIEKTAKKIGAVNTIVNNDGFLVGYNTDYLGAIRALEEITPIAGKKVVLVGAGGAAKAIAFGLKLKEAKVLILNRTLDKAKELAEQTKASFGTLDQLAKIRESDILIHATPTGMSPNIKDSLVPKKYLKKNLIVFDIIYNPKETALIKDAKKVGCQIVYGYKMLLYQGVEQFEMFTENEAPITIMEQALIKELERRIK